jgi:acylpyruvate hydrolase
MRLGTLRSDGSTVAVRIDAGEAVQIDGFVDVGALLRTPDWRTLAESADGRRRSLASIDAASWASPVIAPTKIVCVGLNYRNHILEMGRELPEFPTLFAKFAESLIGPNDPIALPPEAATHVDWEGELAVVIGRRTRRVDPDAAGESIAGYAVFNDVTMRDFQYRTTEWLQGKSWEASSPLGPLVVTADEWSPGPTLQTAVDGETVQSVSTADLVFDPTALVSYISQIFTLQPGDIIATGTPGGVGHARKPPRYLEAGSVLETTIEGLGAQRNAVIREQ